MNEINDAIKVISKELVRTITVLFETNHYDKTFCSVIKAVHSGKYTILYNNQEYDVPNSLGTALSVNTKVWVKIPCGKWEEMHICGTKT